MGFPPDATESKYWMAFFTKSLILRIFFLFLMLSDAFSPLMPPTQKYSSVRSLRIRWSWSSTLLLLSLPETASDAWGDHSSSFPYRRSNYTFIHDSFCHSYKSLFLPPPHLVYKTRSSHITRLKSIGWHSSWSSCSDIYSFCRCSINFLIAKFGDNHQVKCHKRMRCIHQMIYNYNNPYNNNKNNKKNILIIYKKVSFSRYSLFVRKISLWAPNSQKCRLHFWSQESLLVL